MADATQLASIELFQWSRPDAPNPRLAAPISATTTTLLFTDPPLDENDAVIDGNFLMGIRNQDGYTETVWVPSGNLSSDGLTATSVVRGVRLGSSLDYTTGVAALGAAADQDSPVFCNIAAVNFLMMVAAMQGTIGSGGANWRIGRVIDENITVYAQNADASKPFFRYDATTNQWVYSNDGVSSTAFGTGAGITGGDGISVTGGDVDIDLTDTTIFRNTRSGNELRVPTTLVGTGLLDVSFMPTNVQEANTFFGLTDITGTEAETLTNGSNADALHIHSSNKLVAAPIYTNVTTAANTNEQTLLSVSIPANTLGAGNAIRLKWSGMIVAVADTKTMTFRFKYGSTTLASIVRTHTLNTNSNVVGSTEGEFLIYATGATNSQEGVAKMTSGETLPVTNTYVAGGTATEDSTGVLNLVLTIQLNDSTSSFTFQNAHVEVLRV